MSTHNWSHNDSIISSTDSNDPFSNLSLLTTQDKSHGINLTFEISKKILLIIAGSLLILFYLPFSIYYSYKIYRNRYSIIVHKRFPYLILVTVIGNCIYLSTEKTIMLLISFNYIACPTPEYEDTLEFIIDLTIHWVFIYALYLTVLRFWLLYFKLEWALSNINNRWQSILNSRSGHQDWFLRNKKKYGSYTWLITKVLIFTTILVILNILRISLLYTIELEESLSWNKKFSNWKIPFDLTMGFIIYTPALLIMIYIICKLPTFDDYLLIREEARFSVYVFVLITTVNIATAVLDEQSEPDKGAHIQSYHNKIEPIVHIIVYLFSLTINI